MSLKHWFNTETKSLFTSTSSYFKLAWSLSSAEC